MIGEKYVVFWRTSFGPDQHCFALVELRAYLIQLRLLGLHVSFGRIHSGHCRVVCRLPLVEILLGDQTVLEKSLSALEVQIGLFQVGLLLYQIRLRGPVARLCGLHTRLGGIH